MKPVVFDFSMLIWDSILSQEYPMFYKDLSFITMQALSFIENEKIPIYLPKEAVDVLLMSFPYTNLKQDSPELWDFVLQVYSFLAKEFNEVDYSDVNHNNIEIKPKLCSFNTEPSHLLVLDNMIATACYDDIEYIISTSMLWPNNDYISIETDKIKGNLNLLKDQECWNKILCECRVLMLSPKHLPFYGWGTIEESCKEHLENALKIAISTDSLGKKVLYSIADKQIHVFRYDNNGTYRPYPITPRDVPIQVLRNFIRTGLISKGKAGKVLKRKAN